MKWFLTTYLVGVAIAWVLMFFVVLLDTKSDFKGAAILATVQAPLWPLWLVLILVGAFK